MLEGFERKPSKKKNAWNLYKGHQLSLIIVISFGFFFIAPCCSSVVHYSLRSFCYFHSCCISLWWLEACPIAHFCAVCTLIKSVILTQTRCIISVYGKLNAIMLCCQIHTLHAGIHALVPHNQLRLVATQLNLITGEIHLTWVPCYPSNINQEAITAACSQPCLHSAWQEFVWAFCYGFSACLSCSVVPIAVFQAP